MDLPPCERCGERPANVLFKSQDGDHVSEIRLCETCAQEDNTGEDWGLGISLAKLLSGMVDQGSAHASEAHTPPAGAHAECATCGLVYADFVKGGRLGCESCYAAFEDALPTVFGEVQQGHTAHRGRVPPAHRERRDREETLGQLRAELGAAVSSEEYELAAELRDKIRDLEREGTTAPHGGS